MTTFLLFNEIERDGVVSQETLATRLGVAVGLTNAYIRRCVRKGLIKMRKVPARRYCYFLTPKGFAEKGRLTREYLFHSFDFFRRARHQVNDLLTAADARCHRRILLYGASELAEVVILSALETPGISLVGVVAEGRNTPTFAGLKVFASLEEAQPFDAILLSDLQAPGDLYATLRERFEDEVLLLPPLLHVLRSK